MVSMCSKTVVRRGVNQSIWKFQWCGYEVLRSWRGAPKYELCALERWRMLSVNHSISCVDICQLDSDCMLS